MATIDDVKEAANPFAKITDATRELIEATKVSNDLHAKTLKVTGAILEEKKKNHKEWSKAANRRFYILVVGALVTATVAWLDVLMLNDDSEVIGGVISAAKALAGLLL